MFRLRSGAALAAVVLFFSAIGSASADTTVVTGHGTWTAYPGQTSTNAVAVQQPINADGSSNFKANGKGVIPVKFALSSGVGPFAFESIYGDASDANDFSYVSFAPSASTTFSQITQLSAVYAFTTGDCHGGALRWSVRTSATQSVFIYYGNPPQFGNGGIDGCTGTGIGSVNQSGTNLIGLADLRYDTSQYFGGTFYDPYAHALTLVGTSPIVRASLVLDAGWAGNQIVTLTSASFATGGYTDTFVAPTGSSPVAPACPTQAATIKITKTSGAPSGAVNEPETVQPSDNNELFRMVDCKYMYNLATSSLSGVGTYKVEVVIDGVPASGAAIFDLK